MLFFNVFIAFLLSFFSTAIMTYISMATPIGPWIETTLVLGGMLIFYAMRAWYTEQGKMHAVGLTTAAGGIGGILATACGFSFPTLFFIDNPFFCELMSNPLQFALVVSFLALAAGSFGLVVAHVFEQSLIVKQELPFPIGELVYKMISATDSIYKAYSLALGFIGTFFFLTMRVIVPFLSQPIVLLHKLSLRFTMLPTISLQTDLLPMFWAIGFVTGHVIAIPLLLGLLARILVIEPLHYFFPAISSLMHVQSLIPISLSDFTIAFCSGMVLYGASMSFLELPKLAYSAWKNFSHGQGREQEVRKIPWFLIGSMVVFNVGTLLYFKFSLLALLYLLIFTLICTYQMMLIAGKIGLAPLGRFATFVMVPGMFIFGYTPLQVTFVAAYVEIAGGVACDTLFGRKMARLAHIEPQTINRYQWLGLIVSCVFVGILSWIFIYHFGIGSQPGALAAARAAGRALMINVKTFNMLVLALGFIFGFILKLLRVNAILMLGGILMSPELSIMLILGGMSTYLVKEKEDYYPFWSGYLQLIVSGC